MQLSVRDVAKLLEVSEKSIYRWVKQGVLPAYRVADQYRFNRAELLDWATSRRMNVSSELVDEPESNATPIPSLTEELDTGGIFYRIEGANQRSVLQSVVDHLRLPEEVDRDFLLRVLLAREALQSTAVGDGIAIPHARNPVVLHVSRPQIALCFLERPIEYGALDGKPVQVLFGLISPTVRAHLRLLSRLAFALNDPAFKRVVLRVAAREAILREAKRVDSVLSGRRRPVVVRG